MKEYKYKINGNTYKVGVGDLNDNVVEVEVNGVPYKVEMEAHKAATVKTVSAPKAAAAPRTASGEKVIAKATGNAGGAAVKAALPGVVLSLPVKRGDRVEASDTVLVIEAIRRENSLHSGAHVR